MNTYRLLRLLTDFAIVFGLMICITAAKQPMDVERFVMGLFVMVCGTWVRVLAGETE